MTQIDDIQKKSIHISCAIFNKVFTKKIDTAIFYYKHYQNPHKIPTPLFDDKIDGEIAGINGFMGAKFVIGTNEVFAAQSCDSAVLPQHRGKGVFSRIIHSAEKQCEMDGISFLFGFPNGNSYPRLIKLGWVHVGDFYRAFLPLNTGELLERKFGKSILTIIAKIINPLFQKKMKIYAKKSTGVDIQIFENCPFVESDYEVINRAEGIMIKRSAEYYKWKVDNNPSKRFKYIVARDRDCLLGFIIYEAVNGRTIDVVDWQSFDPDKAKKKIVLAKLFYQLKGQGAVISIDLVNAANGEMKMLESLGFLNASNRIIKQDPLPLIVKTFSSGISDQLFEVNNWILRGLDTDVMIS